MKCPKYGSEDLEVISDVKVKGSHLDTRSMLESANAISNTLSV